MSGVPFSGSDGELLPWAAQAEQVLPGEVDDSADGADEAEQDQRYARCKPLAPVDSARWHAGQPSRLGRIFYGNDNFFIFFRLHQHLSDRQAPSPVSHQLRGCPSGEPLLGMHSSAAVNP